MGTVAHTAAGVMLASAVMVVLVLKKVGVIAAAPPAVAAIPDQKAAESVPVD